MTTKTTTTLVIGMSLLVLLSISAIGQNNVIAVKKISEPSSTSSDDGNDKGGGSNDDNNHHQVDTATHTVTNPPDTHRIKNTENCGSHAAKCFPSTITHSCSLAVITHCHQDGSPSLGMPGQGRGSISTCVKECGGGLPVIPRDISSNNCDRGLHFVQSLGCVKNHLTHNEAFQLGCQMGADDGEDQENFVATGGIKQHSADFVRGYNQAFNGGGCVGTQLTS